MVGPPKAWHLLLLTSHSWPNVGSQKSPVPHCFPFLGGYGSRAQFIQFCIQGLMVTSIGNRVGTGTLENCDSENLCVGQSLHSGE